ncbi:MAG: UbiA family prenyltransferase [Desulfopila sp.]
MDKMEHTGVYEKIVLSLSIAKFPLCALVAFSALFGHIFALQAINRQSFLIFTAVLMLSCGSASLNSYQERLVDALMLRTSQRPLVRQKLSAAHALVQTGFLIFCGLMLLLWSAGVGPFVAGILGAVIYNVVYTRMKQYSLHALIPGVLCGAIPPYIGWLAAGGEMFSFQAALPVLLLIFWQIPHFFLVVLNHKGDYSSSASPTLLQELSEHALQRIFLPWITALALIMITLSTMPPQLSNGVRIVIIANGLGLIGFFYYQMLFAAKPNYRMLFRYLNMAIFLVMAIICFDYSVAGLL